MEPLISSQGQPTSTFEKCDDIDSCNSVFVVKRKVGCLCCAYFQYSVYSRPGNVEILTIETVSPLRQCCSFCTPPVIEIYSTARGKNKIGFYAPPCCGTLKCENGLRTTVDGHYAGGIQTVFHKCMCLCCCPNYVYDVIDSSDQRQYVIGNDYDCRCMCLNCTGCCKNCFKCCGTEKLQLLYDIRERDMNNPPSGGFMVNYEIQHCCCVTKSYYPTFDIDFPPNTPRDAKLNILSLCAYF